MSQVHNFDSAMSVSNPEEAQICMLFKSNKYMVNHLKS